MSPLDLILYSLLVAAISVCYHAQLVNAGHLLCGWHNWLMAVELKLRRNYCGPTEWRYKAYCWITKSTRECAWCLAGQLAIAHYLLRFGVPHGAQWLDIILHTGASIVLAAIIMKQTTHAIKST